MTSSDLNPQDREAGSVQPDAGTVRTVQGPEVEIAPPRHGLAGIVKDGPIEVLLSVPPVFGRGEDRMTIPESIVAEATQIRTAAQIREQEERHRVSRTRERRRCTDTE